MKISPRILATSLFAATSLAVAAVLVLDTSGGHANSCSDLMDEPAANFLSTPQTYDFLRRLDAAGCARVSGDEFDEFALSLDLNIVSYNLLEERLL